MNAKKEIASITSEWQSVFPKREKQAHKGDFGRVFILAGSRGLCGAGLLAAMGALRSGAGLISLGTPEECAALVLQRIPEVMVKPLAQNSEGSLASSGFSQIESYLSGQNVVALGPGLSQQPDTQALIRRLVSASKIPVVLDADGLNAFQNFRHELQSVKVPLVLTPHPGEFARLFARPASESEEGRKRLAVEGARETGATLVLKGAGTVVAGPEGRVFVNPTGNPGMAKGGSGDILTGMIASFIAQGIPVFEAAKFGVFIHGLSGDLAAKQFDEVSMTPGDLLNHLPEAFISLRGKG